MHPPIYRYDQSSKRLFFDLVRRTTGVAFTEDDVHVSPPRALGRNHTEVILSPTHQSPLTGSVPVTYNRLDLSLFSLGYRCLLRVSTTPHQPTCQLGSANSGECG